MSLQSRVFGLKPVIHHCLSATCLCRRNRQVAPLREYGCDDAVLLRQEWGTPTFESIQASIPKLSVTAQ